MPHVDIPIRLTHQSVVILDDDVYKGHYGSGGECTFIYGNGLELSAEEMGNRIAEAESVYIRP